MPAIGRLDHYRQSGDVINATAKKEAVQERVDNSEKKKRLLSTLLTGPQGLVDPAMIQRKTLLGH